MNSGRNVKVNSRLRRAKRVRMKMKGTAVRPRLVVFKSIKHIYAQLVDDSARKTLTGVSSLKGSLNLNGNPTDMAKSVGDAIAKKAQDLGVKTIVFDRSGYLYHGKIKALAEAVRKAGLEF